MFTIKQFNDKYPNDKACLSEIFKNRYRNLKTCPTCNRGAKFYPVTKRKCYSCQWCSHQLHPLAGTIFHKSETPLKSWFFAIFLFANSKNGVSAMELQRQLGVTYKTAWRMAHQIRLLFHSRGPKLRNVVELDESYVGGKGKGKRGRGSTSKTPVFGMVERGGRITAKVVPDAKRKSIIPILTKNVALGTRLMTDEYITYDKVRQLGYYHWRINHGAKQYARGKCHVNTLEGFWSQLKRSINGTYHAVSPKYLQHYVDEFAYRYSRRKASSIFLPMVLRAGRRVRLAA